MPSWPSTSMLGGVGHLLDVCGALHKSGDTPDALMCYLRNYAQCTVAKKKNEWLHSGLGSTVGVSSTTKAQGEAELK